MADRVQIAAAVSLALDGEIPFALTSAGDRAFATVNGVWGHFGIGGQVGQAQRTGLLKERLVKKGICD